MHHSLKTTIAGICLGLAASSALAQSPDLGSAILPGIRKKAEASEPIEIDQLSDLERRFLDPSLIENPFGRPPSLLSLHSNELSLSIAKAITGRSYSTAGPGFITIGTKRIFEGESFLLSEASATGGDKKSSIAKPLENKTAAKAYQSITMDPTLLRDGFASESHPAQKAQEPEIELVEVFANSALFRQFTQGSRGETFNVDYLFDRTAESDFEEAKYVVYTPLCSGLFIAEGMIVVPYEAVKTGSLIAKTIHGESNAEIESIDQESGLAILRTSLQPRGINLPRTEETGRKRLIVGYDVTDAKSASTLSIARALKAPNGVLLAAAGQTENLIGAVALDESGKVSGIVSRERLETTDPSIGALGFTSIEKIIERSARTSGTIARKISRAETTDQPVSLEHVLENTALILRRESAPSL